MNKPALLDSVARIIILVAIASPVVAGCLVIGAMFAYAF
jgi:hypothetical protein